MGITKLTELIKSEVPEAVKSVPLQEYRGRIIAMDASICIYQFSTGMPAITNRHGENISHLQGLFYRTAHLLENGIKPVYVFEGRPPELKKPLLAKRAAGSGRSGRDSDAGLGSSQKQDCETLLSYLGVPSIKAPGEAEATCAALVACGKAWGTATEDMDALPFRSTRLIRHLKADKNCNVDEYFLPLILEKLKLTHEQKHPVPSNWHLQETRALFLQPQVADTSHVLLEWAEPNEEQLVRFLSHQKHMKEERVRKRLEKLRIAHLEKEKAKKQREAPNKKRQKFMQEYYPVKKSPCRMKVSKPQKLNKQQKVRKVTVRSEDAVTQCNPEREFHQGKEQRH